MGWALKGGQWARRGCGKVDAHQQWQLVTSGVGTAGLHHALIVGIMLSVLTGSRYLSTAGGCHRGPRGGHLPQKRNCPSPQQRTRSKWDFGARKIVSASRSLSAPSTTTRGRAHAPLRAWGVQTRGPNLTFLKRSRLQTWRTVLGMLSRDDSPSLRFGQGQLVLVELPSRRRPRGLRASGDVSGHRSSTTQKQYKCSAARKVTEVIRACAAG